MSSQAPAVATTSVEKKVVPQAAGEAKVNLTEQVYEQLVQILISGELRPGDVIVERKMAERLNASRTPIREALSRLEAERLLYKQANRGVTVAPFSTEALIEILNVRQLLEAEAARLAAGHVPKAKLAEIRAQMAALAEKEQTTLAEIWAVDDLLHGAITEAAGNSLLASTIRDLRRRTHVMNAFRNPHESSFDLAENSRLVDAIEGGDAETARATMERHISNVKVAIINRLTGISR